MIPILVVFTGQYPQYPDKCRCPGCRRRDFRFGGCGKSQEKDAARILVRNALQELDLGRCLRIVRINGLDTPYWQEDLEEVIPCLPDLIMPAKISSPQEIEDLEAYLTKREEELCRTKKEAVKVPGKIGLFASYRDSSWGENAFAIAAASPRVQGLFLVPRI